MKQFFFIVLVVILTGCSVQKRVHRNGFYVNWHKEKNNRKENSTHAVVTKPAAVKESSPANLNVPELNFPKEVSDFTFFKKRKTTAAPEDSCDLVIFKDGSEVKAKVLEVGISEIQYKKCDMLNGPLFRVKKNDVFIIKYANGSKEIIKPIPDTPAPYERPRTPRRPPRELPQGALFSFIISIVAMILRYITFFIFVDQILLIITAAFLIFSILLIVYSKRLYNEIKRNPDKLKGAGFPHTAFVLGIINLCINAIALYILLVFF